MSVDGSHFDPEQCGGNAAPYVLGALTEEEHEAYSRHVDSCAVCREEVAALEVVAAALPSAAPQVSAPPELKRRVMASVREDARRREAEEAAAAGAAARESASTGEHAARTRGAGSARRRALTGRLRWQPALPVAGLAAAAILLAVVALSSGGSGGSGGGAGARVIHAQVLVPRASASLDVSDGQAQLDIARMPPAGPGRVYEVWREQGGTPHPTDALFTVSSNGRATVGVPGGVKGVQEVLVTSEPQGGTQVPTRAPVIVARLS
jgi:hypothetical protein